MNLNAISVSGDHRWIVCGTLKGAIMWDGDLHGKVIDIEGTNAVCAVDVSPDSTRFAIGTDSASIWNITSRERLVGPLKHNNAVRGIRFSPDGERFATACFSGPIQIFDSRTIDKLVTIKIDILGRLGTPLEWSSDGQRIFAASSGNKIKSFNTSTGSLLAESQILHGSNEDDVYTIALAGANDKFITTFAGRSITFLDTSTLTQIGPVIEDNNSDIWSIALSPDGSHLAAGQVDGKIVIRDLSKILPDSYGPFHASRLLPCHRHPTNTDKPRRYPRAKKYNRTKNLRHRAAKMTKYPSLIR